MRDGRNKIDPSKDGIDHINIYSKGKTSLGRFLTNFSHSPIITEDGLFESVEGYWYWLLCDSPDKDLLRREHGWKAKQLGRVLNARDWDETTQFKQKILKAIEIKLDKNPQYKEQLQESKLPLRHYYLYGDKIVEPIQGKWILYYLATYQGEKSEGV